ncbi:unnamed protein product [Didymodactylos carnosus]|uniref:TOM1-like protein 2 n=1 Tax=Didymodactylos carnosus TaxID=1234261 RepID=A0A8S2LAI1_9BILA|nr:unnamed protein product [Didymodactylos carnosus]CAF3879365.1 unnamed protein product [Didymodactylos carnosus]
MAGFFRTTAPTPLQQAIEKATDPTSPTEDWGLIMKICDYVNQHEDSAKEAMKTIRKRLQGGASNGWRSISLTLTLLESLTKNCGKQFHQQIASKDFLKELKNVIGPKNNPPLPVQEKVLGMIQTWAMAMRHDPDLKIVDQFYLECKQQGLEFPAAENESTVKNVISPTGTLDRSSQVSRTMNHTGVERQPFLSSPPHQQQLVPGGQTGGGNIRTLTAEQIAKLRSELDVVQTNVQVFGEMLVTLIPGEENEQDFELLSDLYKTCTQMQARVIDLLSQVAIGDITADLLRYNDELNNTFKNYESYMEQREKVVGPRSHSQHYPNIPSSQATASSNRYPSQTQQQQQLLSKKLPTTSTSDDQPALIKFDDEITPGAPHSSTQLATGFQNMRLNQPSDTVPKPFNSTASHSSAHQNAGGIGEPQVPERDIKEIEVWLKTQGDKESDNEEQATESGTTPAFENFLRKRASSIPENTNESHVIHPTPASPKKTVAFNDPNSSSQL